MNTLSYKTVSANKATVKKEWVVVDAKDMVVGRLASNIAMVLRGKNKPSYTPHVDCGDNVIVINAEQAIFTGSKTEDKEYVSHSGYPGGQKHVTASEMFRKKPIAVIEHAVKGMLPRTRLGRSVYGNMRVYVGNQDKRYLELVEKQKAKLINFER